MQSVLVHNKSEDSSDSAYPLVPEAATLESSDSFSSSTSSARGGSVVKVLLNVYDLNPINCILSPVGVGLFHSGIQINEWEYSFASKGEGIFKIPPRTARGVRFREQIEMGVLDGDGGDDDDDEEEQDFLIAKALEALRPRFQANNYDLVNQNCNHFCDAFLQELLGKSLPAHINRMSKIWTTANIQWMVPRRIRQSAPTGDKNMKAYGGLVPFLVSAVEISSLVVKEWIDSSQSITKVVSTCQKLSVLMEEGVASTGVQGT